MNLLKYVNIKQGTKSVPRFSNGNTLPLVQRPFGFVSFSPQTDISRHAWFYHPDDRSFEGIRVTHQPCPWIGDHGAIVIQPQSEDPYMEAFRNWSSFCETETVLMPHYMRYYLNRPKATFELTPTEYGACMKINFDNPFQNYISILPVLGFCEYYFDAETCRLYCYTDGNERTRYDKGKAKAYFVFDFDRSSISVDDILIENQTEKKSGYFIQGEQTAIHLAVKSKEIIFSMASSYISYEQAERNLENDRCYTSFEDLKEENGKLWNAYLGRIQIKADEEAMKTFYSCMYRVFLFPHKAYEKDKDGMPIHYAPATDNIKKGYRYTDNGFWDTYRTLYPLLAIIAREEYREILEGFISDYIDGGWLPCWTSMDAKKCMPSTLIDAVIADAAVKGILTGELLEVAFEGMEKHANITSPIDAYGREGCEYYVEKGYVPCDKHNESVNLTLDAAYCDYCIGVVANILEKQEKATKYFKRSENYKNIFDTNSGFMRGKSLAGEFRKDFNPTSWGLDYTEAAAWQTSFAVQHDFEGLAELYGGREQFLKKLDEFFAEPREYRVGGYGFEIHEMSEFAAGNWGQCAICNQPSFHIPFIYAYFGEVEKTNYWVHKICREAFTADNDGFPGDEDNGTMAAWYVFSMIGIYPLCPGKDEYIITEPLATDVKILGEKIELTTKSRKISYSELI